MRVTKELSEKKWKSPRSVYVGGLNIFLLFMALIYFAGCTEKKETREIRFYGIGTEDIGEKRWQTFEKELGIIVKFNDNNNDVGPIISNMINGTAAYDFDVSGVQGGAEKELAIAGKILPWDTTKLSHWTETWSWIRQIPNCYVDGKLYGLPFVANADAIIYLPEKTGGLVTSYSVIFDPKYKGKVAMEDSWINSVIFTAIYLKENNLMSIDNPGDLSEPELKGVMEFLIKKKKEGQFKTFWDGWENGLNLIKSGEVYAMTGWEPIQIEAKKSGVKCEYAEPREGYEGWTNNLLLNAGVKKNGRYNDAHEFANWLLGGYYGCIMATERGYVVPNDLATDYAKKGEQFNSQQVSQRLETVKNKLLHKKIFWQNTRPRNYKLYEEWWAKLRNA